MAQILVTGSRGTLGSRLVRELKNRGHVVYGLDLQHSADKRYMRADVGDYRQLERAIGGEPPFDFVYHLAAEFGRLNGEEYYETLWRTNVIGTRHLLELQRQHGFKLIFTSSSEIYGETGEEWISEDVTKKQALHQANDYAISKWVNELQIMNCNARYGTESVRARLFNAYGPGEYYHPYRSVVCLFCYSALAGIPWQVYKNYKRVFQYVDELIPTLATICERFAPGEVVNIGGEEYRSVEDLSAIVLRETGADPKLVSYVGEDTHNVRNKRPLIAKARLWLGHNPVLTLEEGVPRTLNWMRAEYSL